MTKAIVYIEESNSMADVTFPSIPVVISLFNYDDNEQNKPSLPVAGYPVICVTVCAKPVPTFAFLLQCQLIFNFVL